MDKVSLYIPCYNADKFIDEALRGVKLQTYPVDEIIVVDDGSTDDTVAKASRYNVRIIRHGENKGLAAARNTAVTNAKNEFVASLDADCVPSADWLERLMKNCTGEKIAGVGGKLIERHASTLADRWRAVYMRQHWGNSWSDGPRFLFGSNNVFRKDALLKAGIYNVMYRSNFEDCDISLRLKEKGYRLIYEPRAVAEHLRTDTLRSVLDTHWRWTFLGTTCARVPNNLYNVACKTYDNLIYLFRDMLKKDLAAGRFEFIPVDLLFLSHHFAGDIKYYLYYKFRPGRLSRYRGGA